MSTPPHLSWEKTAEEGAELTALLSLCTSVSPPCPLRNRHLCTLILGSIKTHVCCWEWQPLAHWCIGCDFFAVADRLLELPFCQHLYPPWELFLLGCFFYFIPWLWASASAYILLYTVAHSNTLLKRPPVLSLRSCGGELCQCQQQHWKSLALWTSLGEQVPKEPYL